MARIVNHQSPNPKFAASNPSDGGHQRNFQFFKFPNGNAAASRIRSAESQRSVCTFLQLSALPIMMPDADKDNGNGPRAGGYQWPTAPHAGWRHHVAAHVSGAAAPQLPAVLLGSARLAHRHVDATDRDELVRLSNHEFEIFARCGSSRGFRA